MYTTVLSLATAPSTGSRCVNPVIRSAVCHSASRNWPSMATAVPPFNRTARTCCGAGGGVGRGGGESIATRGGVFPARASNSASVVDILRPEQKVTVVPGRERGRRARGGNDSYDRRSRKKVAKERSGTNGGDKF